MMFAEPAEIPVTTPDKELTVATPEFEVVQIPPAAALVYGVVDPTQMLSKPVIVGTTGDGLTITAVDTVVEQPLTLVTV
jgi:hypothetical protein